MQSRSNFPKVVDMADVKITVVRRTSNKELLEKYASGEVEPECERFKTGDEFIVKDLKMPEGFCSWAWADIQRDVAVLTLNGNFFWVKEKGVGFSCCTDGFRPVVFKLERLRENEQQLMRAPNIQQQRTILPAK